VAGDLVARFRAARRDPALVVLEGLHALKHALRFGAAIELATSPDPAAVAALAERLAPDVAAAIAAHLEPCRRDVFQQLAPVPPQTGVLALAARPVVDETALAARPNRPVVVLDAPRHLGNVGAAVRVAAAADAAGVVVVGEVDPWQPAAVRGAAGLQFALPCLRLDAAGRLGRPLVGFDAAGEPLAARAVVPGNALVFGGERHGLTPATRRSVDRLVALPMRPRVSSLNLATAVAAALYTIAPPATPPGAA
jgi:TrmH family RNA methyltransferase